jgi:hypothetical protein
MASVIMMVRMNRDPARQLEAHRRDGRLADDRDRVGRDAGHRHLRQAHHAAHAGEHGHRQRDQAQHQRLRADLVDEERRCDERVDHQRGDPQRGLEPGVGVQSRRGTRVTRLAHRLGRQRKNGRSGAPQRLAGSKLGRVHRLAPSRPSGRNASAATSNAKVNTTP